MASKKKEDPNPWSYMIIGMLILIALFGLMAGYFIGYIVNYCYISPVPGSNIIPNNHLITSTSINIITNTTIGNFSFVRNINGFLNVFNGTYSSSKIYGFMLNYSYMLPPKACTITTAYIIIGNGSIYTLNSSYTRDLIESGLNDTPFCNKLNAS
jgi:hypothetical protein